MSNDIVKMNTAVSQWTNSVTDLVANDFALCGVEMSEYSKQCAMGAMTSIYQLVTESNKVKDLNELDKSNLREIVGQCASLKLNANAVPRECYFQLRSKQINGNWVQVVEMGIEGDGNDALLRQFGENVDTVYPVWLVKEGDDFEYPRHMGIETTPPSWTEKGLSQKVIRVVYPVKMTDGTVQYLIAERESVKTNLFAHIRNNMMNETFGICKDRYKATDEQKLKIKAKKEEIFEVLRNCDTLEDMLACEVVKPYISAAWLDTPESMIVRKMRNNAIKKFKKNYDTMAKRSYMQLDEAYQASQEEIIDNANAIDFPGDVIEAEVVDET